MINYSIIIPHYNIPNLLARCLRSIPEREDIQVIVVDDNSLGNEKYLEQIPELSRKNIEFYVTKDGMGAGHARNVGLKHAKGKWLVFSDSDDFFSDYFSECLDEYINDDHDIIYFNVNSCDCYETSHIHEINKLKQFQNTGNDIFLRICYTEPWGKFIKNSLVQDNNIKFQETKAHNDLLFAVRTGLSAKSVLVVDKPIYWYVIREGSLGHSSVNESVEKICDRASAWHATQCFLNENGIETTLYLPVFICIRALKQDTICFIKLILFMRKNNMKYLKAIKDTIRYLFLRMTNIEALNYHNMLSEDSVVKWNRSNRLCL